MRAALGHRSPTTTSAPASGGTPTGPGPSGPAHRRRGRPAGGVPARRGGTGDRWGLRLPARRPARDPVAGGADHAGGRAPGTAGSGTVDVPGQGSFRVAARARFDGTGVEVAGQSTGKTDAVLGTLVLWEVVVALGAVGVAALVGRVPGPSPAAAPARGGRDRPRGLRPAAVQRGDRHHRAGARAAHRRAQRGRAGRRRPQHHARARRARPRRAAPQRAAGPPVRRRRLPRAAHPAVTIHGYAELSRRTRPTDPAQLALAMGKVEAEATRMSCAGRGPAAAGAPGRRSSAGPRRGRPHPAGPGDRGRRARGRTRAPVAARPCRRAGRRAGRRAAPAPGRSPTCSTTPAGTPRRGPRSGRRCTAEGDRGRRHGHRRRPRDDPRAGRHRLRALHPRGLLPHPRPRAAPGWGCPWCRPSRRPTAARSTCGRRRARTCFEVRLPALAAVPATAHR